MRILKFGGKSLATIEKTQKICKNIKKIYEKDKKLIIVVSAMGDTTNKLLHEVKNIPQDKLSKRELDVLLSTGETKSASIFAMVLNSIGIPAKSYQSWQIKINGHGDYQNSLITSIDKNKLEQCINKNIVAVVAGFQAVNQNNEIVTIGRGGSDTTAVALGAVFQTNVELYSDFNGMFSCDPRLMHTKKLKNISLEHLESLALDGVKLVSQRAVKIAKENNISLIMKCSSKPNLSGTTSSSLEKENLLISTKPNLCEVTINFNNEHKIKLLSKNVINWLNNYKLYNFTLNSYKIAILINESDKNEVLDILARNLKL